MLLRFQAALVITLATLFGCEFSPVTYPVSGKVVFVDDRPVTSGVIEFEPVDGGPPARGKIESDGRFSLTTGTRSGAVAGKHRIAIVQVGASGPVIPGHKHKGITVDKRYARFESSGLTQTVKTGEPNEFTIEVDATR